MYASKYLRNLLVEILKNYQLNCLLEFLRRQILHVRLQGIEPVQQAVGLWLFTHLHVDFPPALVSPWYDAVAKQLSKYLLDRHCRSLNHDLLWSIMSFSCFI